MSLCTARTVTQHTTHAAERCHRRSPPRIRARTPPAASMSSSRCCGPPSYDGGSTVVRNTVILGFSLALSFAMLLVAGVVGKNWLPMINLGAIVLVPMAVILSDVMGGAGVNSGVYGELRARGGRERREGRPAPPLSVERGFCHPRHHAAVLPRSPTRRRGAASVDQLWRLLLWPHPGVTVWVRFGSQLALQQRGLRAMPLGLTAAPPPPRICTRPLAGCRWCCCMWARSCRCRLGCGWAPPASRLPRLSGTGSRGSRNRSIN